MKMQIFWRIQARTNFARTLQRLPDDGRSAVTDAP
jgi:hypothetical protein